MVSFLELCARLLLYTHSNNYVIEIQICSAISLIFILRWILKQFFLYVCIFVKKSFSHVNIVFYLYFSRNLYVDLYLFVTSLIYVGT